MNLDRWVELRQGGISGVSGEIQGTLHKMQRFSTSRQQNTLKQTDRQVNTLRFLDEDYVLGEIN